MNHLHFLPLFCRDSTQLCAGAVRVGSYHQHTRKHQAALPSTGTAMKSQGHLLDSCFWNGYVVKWFLSRFCWITEEWEGDWMRGWNWRCKERPAKFCSMCCMAIQPLCWQWLNTALPQGSHRLLYCVQIIISWHIWKDIIHFLIESSIVFPHENPREERVCWSPTCCTLWSFLSKARKTDWANPSAPCANWI